MRAIIIQDKDAKALLDQLKLEAFYNRGRLYGFPALEKLTESEREMVLTELHRKFHYIVTHWLQDQGADLIR